MTSSRALREVLLLLLLISRGTFSFVVRPSPLQQQLVVSTSSRRHNGVRFDPLANKAISYSQTSSSSALNMNLIGSSAVALVKTPFRKMLLALGAALVVFFSKQYKRILWPGSSQDSNLAEPLPPGSFGCPFFGSNVMGGTREYGPYVYLDRKFEPYSKHFRIRRAQANVHFSCSFRRRKEAWKSQFIQILCFWCTHGQCEGKGEHSGCSRARIRTRRRQYAHDIRDMGDSVWR